MILSTVCWVFGILFAIKFIMVLIKTIRNEGKDPAFKKFMEKGFDYSEMDGLTEVDKEGFDKFKKEIYMVFLFGFILFVLIVINTII